MGAQGDFTAGLARRLAGRDLRLVLPEGSDGRILAAAAQLRDSGTARITLLGDPEEIRAAADSAGTDLHGIDLVDPARDARVEGFAALYQRGRPGSREGVALRLVRKPLFFAGMMVRSGQADALLGGAAVPTARVVEAGLMTVGAAPGIRTPSSFFLMLLSARPLLFADCALNVDPSAQELAEIALASARSYAKLFDDPPRVALLSFSTHGSARHPLVEKVREATAIARREAPALHIDGELQLDSALDADIAARKLKEPSEVAGHANVLVFPDLNSGNIAYKLARQLTGAPAIGPLLQGFDRPVGDLSRGASVDEIVTTAQVLLAGVS